MVGEWREIPLGDFVELKRGYDLPKQRRVPGNVPVVSSSGITDYHAEAKVAGPGVVTGRYGTLGEVFYVHGDYWPLNTALYVRDFKGNDPRFVSYFLRGLDFLSYSDKAAVPGLNRNHLHMARVVVPCDVGEQRAIASILSTLDDKIELNRRMSETLEAMTRALFKSWFVDFDPVRAKAEGRDPGVPLHLAALFPDRLVASELGEVPEGWEILTLAEQYRVLRGLSYKGSGLSDAGMPLHNLNSIYEGGGYKRDGIKYYTGEYAERHIVRPGDLIVSNTEQGHDRRLIGHAALVPATFGGRGIFSHHIFRLAPRKGSRLTPEYGSYLLNSPRMHDLVSGYANGTTINMLPVDAVQNPYVAVPPPGLVAHFTAVVEAVRRQSDILDAQSRTLAEARDALLPRLVSGEMRVSGTLKNIDQP